MVAVTQLLNWDEALAGESKMVRPELRIVLLVLTEQWPALGS